MPRIGAEYTDANAGGGSHAVEWARLVFLDRIERESPDTLRSLLEDVLPAHENDPTPLGTPLSDDAEAALAQWAERWHLCDDWIIQDARCTVRTWAEFPQWSRHCFYPDSFGGAVLELGLSPCRPFEPTMETAAAFRERVQRWTASNLEAAVQLEQDGRLIRVREKRARRNDDPGQHYEWLVCWQVKEWNEYRIADIYGLRDEDGEIPVYYESTVQTALEATAEEIGLTLRS